MSSSDPLLQPYQLKHLTLKNRLMSTSHEPSYGVDGMPKDRYRLYHAEKAKGGIALTMTAGSAVVSPDSPAAFGNLHAYDDAIVPWLRELSDACHEYDTAVMMQITHLGRRTNWNHSDWLPVLAPSAVREPAHRAFPKIIEDWDIERVVNDYADTAERMKAGGLDGIELEAYGHLMDQFWSPGTNQRTDEWGGSLENRTRFTMRVLKAIRDRVGSEFIVGIRMVADEQWDIGLSREEGVTIAHMLIDSGHIDFLNLIRGRIDSDVGLSKVIPVGGMPSAPHLDFCGEVRAETKFPVFHAARISDVATARHAVSEGKLDMVGMTRAHMADPHIVNKVAAGKEDDIRPCVGATYCLDRLYEGHEALCIHNPATGREATIPHVVPISQGEKKKCVVVGAGPAGLEAARVLSVRGHQVDVYEAAPQAGGQILLAARVKRRSELIGIVDWRIAQCEKGGVSFHFNQYVEADDIQSRSPDVIVVATGGLPNTDIVPGAAHAVSTWDILSDDVAPAGRVLLFDDNAAHPGLAGAEVIALAGSELEIVTPERYFAADIGGLNHAKYAECFDEHGVRITINKRLVGIRKDGNQLIAEIGSDYSSKIEDRMVDQVVVEHGTLPMDNLYFDLKPHSRNLGAVDVSALKNGTPQRFETNPDGVFQLFRIGDAVSSRNIHAAIYDALRLCMVI